MDPYPTIFAWVLVAGALLLMPALTACVLGYRQKDWGAHTEGFLMREGIDALLDAVDRRFGSRWVPPLFVVALLALAGPWSRWDAVDADGAVRTIATGLAAIIAWQCATLGVNVASDKRRTGARLLVVVSSICVWWHPAALAALLSVSINELHAWEHHRHMPLRTLFALLSFATVIAFAGKAGWIGTANLPAVSQAGLLVILTIVSSHYVIPFIGKLRAGRHPLDWAKDNRFDCIAACSYWWGWRRDRTVDDVLRLSRGARRMGPLIGGFTLAVEMAAAIVAWDPRWCIATLIATATFHVGIFAVCGLFFWEYAATTLVVAGTIAVSSGIPSLHAAFSPLSVGFMLFTIWVSVYVLKLWVPWRISWWDGPLVVVTEMVAVGRSGREYALEARLFGPNSRAVGRVMALAYLDERVIQAHPGSRIDSMDSHDGDILQPGSVRKTADPRQVRDALIATAGQEEALNEVKAAYGRNRYEEKVVAACDRFLQAFFVGLNAGRRVSALPAGLGRLAAPAGQYYRRGPESAFRSQEPVRSIRLRRRQVFYGDDGFVTGDAVVFREISIDLAAPDNSA